jgi:hypothetical protein
MIWLALRSVIQFLVRLLSVPALPPPVIDVKQPCPGCGSREVKTLICTAAGQLKLSDGEKLPTEVLERIVCPTCKGYWFVPTVVKAGANGQGVIYPAQVSQGGLI